MSGSRSNPIHVLPIFFVLILSLASCSSVPSAQSRAKSLHLFEQLIDSGLFTHRIFTNQALVANKNQPVHVYIEGDGHPWLLRNFIAADPTPLNPILLTIMANDASPAIYLGRPCYFDLVKNDTRCTNQWWTSARYSEEIVVSMLAALTKIIPNSTPVTWIGHSGGGTLATLLAARYKHTQALITVAGNLDVKAWTDYHHYSPLNASLDPATQPTLSPAIQQMHFAGRKDTNVLAAWIERYAKRQPNAQYYVVDATHTCCWANTIQSTLQQIQ